MTTKITVYFCQNVRIDRLNMRDKSDISLLNICNSMQFLVVLLLAVCTFGLSSKENVLHDELFETYNKNVRPVERQSTAVDVIIHLIAGFSVDDVDLLRGVVVGNVWLELKWRDQFLSWNATEYDGVEYISVDSKDVWLPDLMLFSQRGKVYMLNHESIGRALVWSDGVVKTYPLHYMDAAFDASVYKYPFDVHNCFIQIGSRSYTNNLVSIKFSAETEATVKQTIQGNGQWEMVNQHVENLTYDDGVYKVDQTRYNFTLKRKSLYYVLNIMAPVAITSALNILCFALPSDSGERITLCISIYLTLAVFLNVVNNALPETSDEQSILSIYIGLQFLATTFTILMTVVTLKFYHQEGNFSCSTSFTGMLDSLRKRKPKYQTESAEGDNYTMHNETSGTVNHRSWKRLSHSLNTVCFYLLVAWNIGLVIAFIVVARS